MAAISCTVLSPRSASSATAALNLSEKFRRFVILVSIHSHWIHLSTLSKFTGPLQYVVGLPERGELAARVGQPLTNRENRSVGLHEHALTDVEAHSHTLSDAGQHTHAYSSTNNGPLHDNRSNFIGGAERFGTVGTKTTTGAGAHNHNLRAAGAHGHELEAAGSVLGTTAPYLQLLACEKE